jgi:hypothetical protein
LYFLYCVVVLLRLCIFILVCFACTGVRTAATERQRNCCSNNRKWEEKQPLSLTHALCVGVSVYNGLDTTIVSVLAMYHQEVAVLLYIRDI